MVRPPFWPPAAGPGERPDRPFTGYKLAHAVLSADGTTAGFAGLTLGATRVYGVVADAECVWSRRHAPPRRWCGCGFYCLHDLTEARALGCATENRAALLLEVAASGQYIRYERGLRSSRQRVRAILDAQCACGRPGSALADAGSGLIGWRHLAPVCAVCDTGRPVVTLAEFTARLGGRVRVAPLLSGGPLAPGASTRSAMGGPPAAPGPSAPGPSAAGLSAAGLSAAGLSAPGPSAAGPSAAPAARPAGPVEVTESAVALLSAEIALLHARLDDLQSRLDPPR